MMHVAAQFAPDFRTLGIDQDTVFSHELIVPWRSLPDRQNCILRHAGVHWHIKRYPAMRGKTLAEQELAGHRALVAAGIPTADLVGWGVLPDRRSFIIFDELRGFSAADKLLAGGLPFSQLLEPTADLAAALHSAGLHHRDLYLCHMFARPSSDGAELRLIDATRVRRLPALTRSRWIIKDLAQFWYSTLSLPVSDSQREQWLARYAARRSVTPISLRGGIDRKARWIARHDRSLNFRQPHRNISIPDAAT